MKMNRREGLPALAFIAAGIIVFIGLRQVPIGTISAPDTAFSPVVLSVLLIILSCVLIGQSFRGTIEKQTKLLGERWSKLLPVIVSLIAYTFLYEPLGYVLCTAGFLVLVGKLANCSWKASLLVSFICTLLSYAIFSWYLHIPLSQGILNF